MLICILPLVEDILKNEVTSFKLKIKIKHSFPVWWLCNFMIINCIAIDKNVLQGSHFTKHVRLSDMTPSV